MPSADDYTRRDIAAPILFSNFQPRALLRQRMRRFLSWGKRSVLTGASLFGK